MLNPNNCELERSAFADDRKPTTDDASANNQRRTTNDGVPRLTLASPAL